MLPLIRRAVRHPRGWARRTDATRSGQWRGAAPGSPNHTSPVCTVQCAVLMPETYSVTITDPGFCRAAVEAIASRLDPVGSAEPVTHTLARRPVVPVLTRRGSAGESTRCRCRRVRAGKGRYRRLHDLDHPHHAQAATVPSQSVEADPFSDMVRSFGVAAQSAVGATSGGPVTVATAKRRWLARPPLGPSVWPYWRRRWWDC